MTTVIACASVAPEYSYRDHAGMLAAGISYSCDEQTSSRSIRALSLPHAHALSVIHAVDNYIGDVEVFTDACLFEEENTTLLQELERILKDPSRRVTLFSSNSQFLPQVTPTMILARKARLQWCEEKVREQKVSEEREKERQKEDQRRQQREEVRRKARELSSQGGMLSIIDDTVAIRRSQRLLYTVSPTRPMTVAVDASFPGESGTIPGDDGLFPAGIGVVSSDGQRWWGRIRAATSTEAEHIGVAAAIDCLDFQDASVTILTDSRSTVDALYGLHGNTVSSRETHHLRMEVEQESNARIEVQWVRGHSGHALNVEADRLAGKARKSWKTVQFD